MKRFLIIIFVFVLTFLPLQITIASDITVLKSSGNKISQGETKLIFQSDSENLEISMTGSWGTQDTDILKREKICQTPCSIVVPNGRYSFSAGNRNFYVYAWGDKQVWEIEEENTPARIVGALFLGLGGLQFLIGSSLLIADVVYSDKVHKETLIIFSAGAAVVTTGIIIFVLSLGHTKIIPNAQIDKQSTRSVSGPAIGLFPTKDGRIAWGLNFAISF